MTRDTIRDAARRGVATRKAREEHRRESAAERLAEAEKAAQKWLPDARKWVREVLPGLVEAAVERGQHRLVLGDGMFAGIEGWGNAPIEALAMAVNERKSAWARVATERIVHGSDTYMPAEDREVLHIAWEPTLGHDGWDK